MTGESVCRVWCRSRDVRHTRAVPAHPRMTWSDAQSGAERYGPDGRRTVDVAWDERGRCQLLVRMGVRHFGERGDVHATDPSGHARRDGADLPPGDADDPEVRWRARRAKRIEQSLLLGPRRVLVASRHGQGSNGQRELAEHGCE